MNLVDRHPTTTTPTGSSTAPLSSSSSTTTTTMKDHQVFYLPEKNMKETLRRFLHVGPSNAAGHDNDHENDDHNDDQTVRRRHHHHRPYGRGGRRRRQQQQQQEQQQKDLIASSSTLAAHQESINSILFHSQRGLNCNDNDDDSTTVGTSRSGDDHNDEDEYGTDEDIERQLMERFSAEFVIDSLRFSFRDDDDDYDDVLNDSGSNLLSGSGGGCHHGGHHKTTDGKVCHGSKLQSCLDLLSSSDLDQNRLGLQRLNLLTKGRALSTLHRSEELASYALIYGTAAPVSATTTTNADISYNGYYHPGSSVEERLRYVFATFICDAPHDDTAMVNKSSFRGIPFLTHHGVNTDDDSAAFSLYYDDDDDDNEDEGENNAIDDHDEDGADEEFFDNLDRLVELSDPKNYQYHENDDSTTDNVDTHPEQSEALVVDDNEDHTEYSSDTEGDDGDDDGITGKEWGALHNQALRVLANALSQISPSPHDPSPRDWREAKMELELMTPHIPLGDTIWRNIIQTLVRNVRNNPNADITGYSLKILRMLYGLHPDSVRPLLSQTLYPHLVHLAEYGQGHRFPLIHQEATALLKRANAEQ